MTYPNGDCLPVQLADLGPALLPPVLPSLPKAVAADGLPERHLGGTILRY